MVTFTNYTNGYVAEYGETCFKSWLLLPAQNLWPEWVRGIFYVTAILYLFIGIAIAADMFMLSIEMITSKKRIIYTFDMEKRERVQRQVFVWNETVANLTLMALGSSAPEILISVFETLATLDDTAPSDSLGLFTIIGSAAYNLLVITAICVMAVPSNTYKSITEFGVFLITSVWSMFAYIWLLIVVKWSSPNIVEVWEAVVTLLFFPLLVLSAWIQDRGFWIYKCQKGKNKNSSMNNNNCLAIDNGSITTTTTTTTDYNSAAVHGENVPMSHLVDVQNTKAQLHHRKNSNEINVVKEKRNDPDLMYGIQKHMEITTSKAYARARFRHGVVLAMTGKKSNPLEENLLGKPIQKNMASSKTHLSDMREMKRGFFCFSSSSYSVTRKEKHLRVDILLNRRNKGVSKVGFSHIVDAARKKSLFDQRPIIFNNNSNVQFTSHTSLSPRNSFPNVGEVSEQDEFHPSPKNKSETASPYKKIGETNYKPTNQWDVTTIQNCDDAHNGDDTHNMSTNEDNVMEGNEGTEKNTHCNLQYLQHVALVKYETRDGNAKSDKDYTSTSGILVFDKNEYRKTIKIPLSGNEEDSFRTRRNNQSSDGVFLENNEGEQLKDFYVLLRDPCHDTILSEPSITHVTIINNNQPGEILFQEPTYHVQYTSYDVPMVTANVVRIHGSDGKSTVFYRTINGTAMGGDLSDVEFGKCDYERVEKGVLSFCPGETSKKIMIPVNPGAEKSRNFIVTLYNVVGLATIGHRCAAIVSLSTEVDEIVEQVTSLANHEEKVLPLKQQFKKQFAEAMSLENDSSVREMCLHFLCFFWKVIFAAVPPRSVWGGWATFLVSLAMLGLLSALVEQFAKLLGCVIGLHISVTGITLVALGTSMPDTFASKTAALHDDSADAAIGNITGSNSVNVFLGLGLPWVIKSVYLVSKGSTFVLNGNNILFPVLVFLGCGMVTMTILVLRRVSSGGELGGRPSTKILTGLVMISLWFTFIVFSSLQAYNVIDVKGL